MYKEEFVYNEPTGEKRVKPIACHLFESVLAENLDLREEFLALQRLTEEPERTLTSVEVGSIAVLLGRVLRLGYGEFDRQTGEFLQDEEITKHFMRTAAAKEFTYSLFYPSPDKAMKFLRDSFPEKLLAEAEKQQPDLMEKMQARNEEVIQRNEDIAQTVRNTATYPGDGGVHMGRTPLYDALGNPIEQPKRPYPDGDRY